ncbi:hypothetical protein [Accumulibacter sp.]|uniref:hypothetical protein n=1 Tax=Accumulibacter sp. TaxID=2053492 RepID=UPI0035B10421
MRPPLQATAALDGRLLATRRNCCRRSVAVVRLPIAPDSRLDFPYPPPILNSALHHDPALTELLAPKRCAALGLCALRADPPGALAFSHGLRQDQASWVFEAKTNGRNMMSRYSINKSRPHFLTTAAAAMLAVVQGATAAPLLDDVVAGVNIDPDQISVSGISSGGFMAHQFHVAHSEHIMGVGVVAGGPYYCSAGSILDAVTKCSQFVMLECRQLGLDAKLCGKTDRAPKNGQEARRVAAASFAEAKTQEAAGRISKLAGLKGDQVYLISAEYDAIVPHGVMDAVFHFYADADKAAIEAGHIAYNRSFPARHTMVRDAFNKPVGDVVGNCALPPAAPPPTERNAFIDDCEAVARQRQARD